MSPGARGNNWTKALARSLVLVQSEAVMKLRLPIKHRGTVPNLLLRMPELPAYNPSYLGNYLAILFDEEVLQYQT